MNTTQRTVLLALLFALIASTLLAVDTDAKRKRKRKHHENRASIVREIPNERASLIDSDILTQPVNSDVVTRPRLDPSVLDQTVNPDILNPSEPDPCAEAETALNGFLPQTENLKKTDTYWARLTVKPGVSVLACDLSSGFFEVKFNNVQLEQFGKASVGGVAVGGWNDIASVSGTIRVSFTVGFTPPSTIVLTNLNILAVNFSNVPNWLDNSVIKDALNAIFPSTIAV
jgi:hypothetical protein